MTPPRSDPKIEAGQVWAWIDRDDQTSEKVLIERVCPNYGLPFVYFSFLDGTRLPLLEDTFRTLFRLIINP